MDNPVDSTLLIAAACQGAAFFTSILLIGFVLGHETVIRHFIVREATYQKAKPSWQQPECYGIAKRKAREFFPLYWYWGNIRSGLLFWLLALLLGSESRIPSAAMMSASLIILTNILLYFSARQKRWDTSAEDQ